LNPYRGLKANNRWLAIASGTGNLLAPLAPRSELVHRAAKGVPQATFWSRGQQISRGDPLWSRSRS
jgi:hypothetical protein